MNISIKKILAVTVLLICGVIQARTNSPLPSQLQPYFGNQKVLSVTATPATGIFEVVLEDHQIVYTTRDGRYVLVGELIDLIGQKNLTKTRMATLQSVNVATLPLEQAIKEVRGTGARKLIVFSDPDCPYCKQLEKTGLDALDNVTIYTFLNPLSMHQDAERKSRVIWCAADRLAAWKQWMHTGQLLTGTDHCDAPIASIKKLAAKWNITVVPTLIFENGQRVSGAVGSKEIEKRLNINDSRPKK